MSNTLTATLRRGAAALALGMALALPSAQVFAAPPKADPDAAALTKVLEQKFPGAKVSNVSKTSYFGLYEAMIEDKLVYTDKKADYVILGSIYDTNTKTNLTEARQRKLNR